MTTSGVLTESTAETDALASFVSEHEVSSTRVVPLPQIDPLLEFSLEEDRAPASPVATDRPRKSAWRASAAWRAFTSEVARDGRRYLTWLSTCQADLKVGLYEATGSLAEAVRVRTESLNRCVVVGLHSARVTVNAIVMRGSTLTNEVAREGRQCLTWVSARGSLAVRTIGNGVDRFLELALCGARAMLDAIAMRGSAFTSRRTSYTRRALIPFGCGVAVGGVFVTLFVPVPSIPGAAMPAPGSVLSQPALQASNVTRMTMEVRPAKTAAPARPPANARSAGTAVESIVATAGVHESDPAPAIAQARPQSPSTPTLLSARRAASPTLARYRGSIAVNSAPKGARVLVNGVPVGTTPLLLRDVPAGSRVVRVELDGYEKWWSAVRVVANQRVLAMADLHPSSNP